MLHFLRTHQRILFLVLSIVIIISFAFFGTYGTFVTPTTPDEEVVHKTASGQEISRGQVERLKRFLVSDADVLPSATGFPNYLHENFLQQLAASGALQEIALKTDNSELQVKLSLEKQWRPFTHSENSSISAVEVWKTFAPGIPANLEKLQKSTDLEEQLQVHFALMQEEKTFPEAYLAQFLLWSQEKQKDISSEVEQYAGQFSLFGYKDASDWLGPKLYDAVLLAIFDAADKVKAYGMTVSDSEVLTRLKQISERGRQKATTLQLNFLKINSPQGFFDQQLQLLRMTPEDAIEMYRPIMLIEKWQEKAKTDLVVDDAMLQSIAEKGERPVVLYEMDAALQLKKAEDLYAFESYLEKVSPIKGELKLASAVEVKKKAPELITQNFALEIKEVSSDNVSLMDVWHWQLQEANWKKLQGHFPDLEEASSAELRADALDALPLPIRTQVDSSSQGEIFKENPALIDQILEKAVARKVDVILPAKGSVTTVFKGLKESSALYEKLTDGKGLISKITFDNKTFYSISLLKAGDLHILSFAEAKKDIRPADIKKYTPVVNNLVTVGKKAGFTKEAGESDSDFAARVRFLAHMEKEMSQQKSLLGTEKEAVKAMMLPNDPWAVKKRTISSSAAKAEGIAYDRLIFAGNHLVFATQGDVMAKADALAIVKQSAQKEALLGLFQ